MRAVIQRVSRASVSWGDGLGGGIGPGLVVLLGVGPLDADADATRLARKVCQLRIFSDADGRFASSLLQVSGAVLVVPQFTLYADCRGGRRPGFAGAAPPEHGRRLWGLFCSEVEALGPTVVRGGFAASMLVEIHNQGPVTIVLSTDPWETGVS